MKPDVKVEHLTLHCLCGYHGVIPAAELAFCPRCKDLFQFTIKVSVLNVEPFELWIRKIGTAFKEDYDVIVAFSEIEKKFKQVVTVEEYMRNKKSKEWDLDEWRGCVMATWHWLHDICIKQGRLMKNQKIRNINF